MEVATRKRNLAGMETGIHHEVKKEDTTMRMMISIFTVRGMDIKIAARRGIIPMKKDIQNVTTNVYVT